MQVSKEDFDALKTEVEELRKKLASSKTQHNRKYRIVDDMNQPSQIFGIGDSLLISQSASNVIGEVNSTEANMEQIFLKSHVGKGWFIIADIHQ